MEKEPRQVASKELIQLAEQRRYVTYDDIIDCSDNFSLSLQDFDWLTNSLTTIGIIIYSESPALAEQFNDEVDDYAQIDYEDIYSKIKERVLPLHYLSMRSEKFGLRKGMRQENSSTRLQREISTQGIE